MSHSESSLAEDEAAIRRLAALYARAMDRNEPLLLAQIFSADAVLEGPGFSMQGHAQICAVPGMLKGLYRMTQHQIHQQTVTVSGDDAEAETYCSAQHLSAQGDGGASVLVWAMRYQDLLRREDGRWRFLRRTARIDWTETRPAQWSPAPAPG